MATITALLCIHLAVYGQAPVQFGPLDGSSDLTIPVTLSWADASQGDKTSKIEVAECGPGIVANNIDLDGYGLVGNPVVISSISDDLSGVTYNPLTNTLFMVQNGTPTVYETTLSGQLLRSIPLYGFNDTEGIVHLGGTKYAVSEERRGRIALIDITSSTPYVNYSDYVQFPGTWGPNTGLEGVSFDPANNMIHTVKEKDDKAYYSFSTPTSFPTTLTNADIDIPCDVETPGLNGPFSFADVAGIHHLGLNDFGQINLDPSISNHVLLLSDESAAIVETDDNCTEYSRLCLPSGEQVEGVTMDNNGVIYAVGEPNKLFIFSNPNFSSGNSKKVVHTKLFDPSASILEEYEIPTNILSQGTEYCWKVSTKGSSFCNWSDTWYFTTEAGANDCPVDLTITNADVAGEFYQAANTIETNPTPGASVLVPYGDDLTLKAGLSVRLNLGFTAKEGAEFRAHIEDCTPTSPKTEQEPTLASVKHYPNPFRDVMNLEFNLEADADAQIIVSDVNGRKVAQMLAENLHSGTQTISLSTTDWIPGIYFYQVQIEEQNTSILKHANGTLIKM